MNNASLHAIFIHHQATSYFCVSITFCICIQQSENIEIAKIQKINNNTNTNNRGSVFFFFFPLFFIRSVLHSIFSL